MLDESFRNSARYKDLPIQGISCTALQGRLDLDKDWVARFTFKGIDKEVAKAKVMAWLSREFNACSFSFYRKADEASHIFYVRFDRGDL